MIRKTGWEELSGNCRLKAKANQQGIRFPKSVEIFLLKLNRPLQFVFCFMIITGHIFLIYIWAYCKTEVVPFQFLALKLFFFGLFTSFAIGFNEITGANRGTVKSWAYWSDALLLFIEKNH